MDRHAVFLRKLNVGGHNVVRMAALREALTARGATGVGTYIQSGNVLLDAEDPASAVHQVVDCLAEDFGVETTGAAFDAAGWAAALAAAPTWWGEREGWKHNVLVLTEPADPVEVLQGLGQLKPGIEDAATGPGVVFQGLSVADFGRTTGGKLNSRAVYRQLTVRNANTARKVLALLQG